MADKDIKLAEKYIKTFSTPDGQEVLADLLDYCGYDRSLIAVDDMANPNFAYIMAINEGQRNVALYIKSLFQEFNEREEDRQPTKKE